ncbi:MAG: hypothetical protein IGS03_14395 [Candidatus Sericytochromatia bacterium]|nr:hypothetical protein [Candidatus Sericytochromatia bacterium]
MNDSRTLFAGLLFVSACQAMPAELPQRPETESLSNPQSQTRSHTTVWPLDGQQKSDIQLDLAAADYQRLPLKTAPQWLLPLPGTVPGWLILDSHGTAWTARFAAGVWQLTAADLPQYPQNITRAPGLQSTEADWLLAPQRLSTTQLERRPAAQSVDCPSPAVLENPVSDYPHGVFGEPIEARQWRWLDADQAIAAAPGGVFESYQPLLLSGCRVLLTHSLPGQGAQLHVYQSNGRLQASSAPVGTHFRWLHMLGASQFHPDLPEEIVAVETPHIDGVVRFYQQEGSQLVPAASLRGYTSHPNRTENLSMALIGRFDNSGWPGLLIPAQNRQTLVWLRRQPDGITEAASWPLNAAISSNLRLARWEAQETQAHSVLAVGTADGVLHIWHSTSP